MTETEMHAMTHEELKEWALRNPAEALKHPDALPTGILACCANAAPAEALEFAPKRLSRLQYCKCAMKCPDLALRFGADLHIPPPLDGRSPDDPYYSSDPAFLLAKCALAAPKEALEFAADRLPPHLRQRCEELVGATQ